MNSHEENEQTVVGVKISKKAIQKWVALAITLIIVAAIAVPILATSQKTSTRSLSVTSVRKVLLIIADGIPADLIENAATPNMKNLGKYKRTYTGGDIRDYTQTPTISAPGYMNVITGTWANKHNVYDNGVKNPNYNYKNIFRLLKEQQPDKKIGIFSTWTDNRVKLVGEGLSTAGNIKFDYKFDGYELDNISYPYDPYSKYIELIDQRVINETTECIKNNAPDLSWVYLQYTDDIGHHYGNSQEFYQAIENLDEQIGQIYDSIEYRINNYREDWLVIITTDHGRDPTTGKGHGAQTERERITWIFTNLQDTNTYFQNYSLVAVDIFPTIARFMNISIPLQSARELDGVPLTGNVSLAKPNLRLSGNDLRITWQMLDKTGDVNIWLSTTNLFKSGQTDYYKLIGTIPIQDQIAIFNIKDYPSTTYKIVLEGRYNMVNRWIVRS